MSAVATLDDLAGITATECPIACELARCTITHLPRCGHPKKGGLGPQDQMNPALLRRRNEALRRLEHAEADAAAARRMR